MPGKFHRYNPKPKTPSIHMIAGADRPTESLCKNLHGVFNVLNFTDSIHNVTCKRCLQLTFKERLVSAKSSIFHLREALDDMILLADCTCATYNSKKGPKINCPRCNAEHAMSATSGWGS